VRRLRGCGPAVTAAIAIVIACSATASLGRDDVSAAVEHLGFIAAPVGGTFGLDVVWLPARDKLAFVYGPPNARLGDAHIYTVGLDGSGLERLPLPDDPPCALTMHVVPGLIADGRLTYVQGCIGSIPRVPDEANALMAYDFGTARASRLFAYYLHATQAQYAVAPDGSHGVISDGRGLSESLLWLRPTEFVRVDLPFRRVWFPSWSTDGRLIALGAVPKSDAQSTATGDSPWNVYVMDSDAGHVRLLHGGFTSVGRFSWSPDGRWLLGTAGVGNAPAGLWLIDVATGRASLVVGGREQPGGAAWLPDGHTIAVTVGVTSGEPVQSGRTKADRVGVSILKLPESLLSQR
jgi:hypothetical protein